MNDNPIRRDARRARRQRTLGPDAACACGETDPRCLVETDSGVRCYGCSAHDAGRPDTERHHIAGRHNLPTTVAMRNNDHRIASDLQQDWPMTTLRNPNHSPLLQAAAAIRGWMDVLLLILERAVGWIPRFLEALDAWLCGRLGDAWWTDFLTTTPDLLPAHVKGAQA